LGPAARGGYSSPSARQANGLAAQVTLSTPRMIEACGSHTNLYVPFFSFTVQVVVPTAATLVFLLTPGPLRWKLCIDERSRMTILYVPAFTIFLLIVIVKPGPSVPVSL